MVHAEFVAAQDVNVLGSVAIIPLHPHNKWLMDEKKPQKRSAAAWLKANILFLLITVLLLFAAAASVTFAYNNGKSKQAQNSSVAAMDATVPDQLAEADSLGNQDSTSNQDNPDNSAQPGNDAKPGQALGDSVNCLQVDSNEAAKINTRIDQLNIGVPDDEEEVLRYNEIATNIFKDYERKVRAKGCSPKMIVDDVLKEVGVNTR